MVVHGLWLPFGCCSVHRSPRLLASDEPADLLASRHEQTRGRPSIQPGCRPCGRLPVRLVDARGQFGAAAPAECRSLPPPWGSASSPSTSRGAPAPPCRRRGIPGQGRSSRWAGCRLACEGGSERCSPASATGPPRTCHCSARRGTRLTPPAGRSQAIEVLAPTCDDLR